MVTVSLPGIVPGYPSWAVVDARTTRTAAAAALDPHATEEREGELYRALSGTWALLPPLKVGAPYRRDALLAIAEGVLERDGDSVTAATQTAISVVAACKLLQQREELRSRRACSLLELPEELLELVVANSARTTLRALAQTCQTTWAPLSQEVWGAGDGTNNWTFLLRLHVMGWARLQGAARPMCVDDTLVLIRRAQRSTQHVFNGRDADGKLTAGPGGKRRQYTSDDLARDEMADIARVLARRGALAQATPRGDKRVRDAFAIASRAGCGKQPPHGDAGDEGAFESHRAADVPLSVLHAIEAHSTLLVYEQGCEGPERRVSMMQRDVVVFVGDFVHAGDEYEKPNTRLHAYVDSVEGTLSAVAKEAGCWAPRPPSPPGCRPTQRLCCLARSPAQTRHDEPVRRHGRHGRGRRRRQRPRLPR